MFDLVGNPKDRFSREVAHLWKTECVFTFRLMTLIADRITSFTTKSQVDQGGWQITSMLLKTALLQPASL